MFSLSMQEMFVIGVVALIFLGPDKLPGLARDLGAMMRKLNRAARDVQMDLEREITPPYKDPYPVDPPAPLPPAAGTEAPPQNIE